MIDIAERKRKIFMLNKRNYLFNLRQQMQPPQIKPEKIKTRLR